MKETVNVNIGSQAFTLDRDAYNLLRNYLNDIRRRLDGEQEETMEDIETRIAELLRERVNSPMRVVDAPAVRAVMERMGAPSDFGEYPGENRPRNEAHVGDDTDSPRRLYRSRSERSIAGVCGGLAAYFDADPTLLRLAALLSIFLGGFSIVLYVILWIVIPEEPAPKFGLHFGRKTNGNEKNNN